MLVLAGSPGSSRTLHSTTPHDDISLSGSLLIQQFIKYSLSYSKFINDNKERILMLTITSRHRLAELIGQTLGIFSQFLAAHRMAW